MTDPYANMPQPQGQFPDSYFGQDDQPGKTIEGTLLKVRQIEDRFNRGRDDMALEVQTDTVGPDGKPLIYSVIAGPENLYAKVYAKRPPVGSRIRVTFTGMSGQAKLFELDVLGQAVPGQQPPAQPQQAPPAAPQQPWGQTPAQQAPAEQPYGQQPPAQPAPPQQPQQAPWGQQPPAQAPAPQPGQPAPWGQ